MTKQTLIIGIFVLLVSGYQVVGENYRVDTLIDKKFENESRILVSVKLEDVSNISLKSTKLTFDEAYSRRSTIFQQSETDVLSALTKSDFEVIYMFNSWNGFSGYLSPSGLDKLKNHPLVEYIEADKILHTTLQQSLPIIGGDDILSAGFGGKGQTICILDSGVNYTHPALGGCFGTGCKVIDGYDFYYNTTDIMDYKGHGTHVTGIAAAYGPLNGTAPYSNIVAHKVCADNISDCSLVKVQFAIDRCIANKSVYNISVISMSLAEWEPYMEDDCRNETTLSQSIDTAVDAGIVVVAASGNNGWNDSISVPACMGGVISVGATYDANFPYVQSTDANCSMNNVKVDNVTCFSNRYQYLDLVAPGEQIISTWHNESGYKALGGTSMAAPHVAGAAAILKQLNSSLTPNQIRDILYLTGTPTTDHSLSGNNAPGSGLTFRRIDIFEAAASVAFSKIISVSNTGNGVLNVTNVTGSASWIYKIEPRNFTLSTNQSKEVTVTVDPRGKSNGIYTGNVIFASNDPDQGNYTVPVTMQILSQGCTGDCPPPASGDWVIDQDTYLYQTPANINGKVTLQGGVTLYIGETHVNATNMAELNGTINLDNGVLRFN